MKWFPLASATYQLVPAMASGSMFMTVYLKVLNVSIIKSKLEIFPRGNKGSLVSHVVKIEGFLLHRQGLVFIVKGKFRGSVSFIAFSK